MVPQEHEVGHVVVTPSQVTFPLMPKLQSRSTIEQVLVPEQLTVPVAQFVTAVQEVFPRPVPEPAAAKRAPLCC
jgi:hypothetical protein